MRDDNPRISIIIPVFNRPNLIERTVKNALKQTIQPEIIIVDDASTDNTYRVIKKLEKKHNNIKTYRMNKNAGPGPCRNKGIIESKGEFIAFLDSDDIYPKKNCLEKMYNLAKEKNVKTCASLRQSKVNNKIIKEPIFRNHCVNKSNGTVTNFTVDQWEYDFTNYIFSRKVIIENNIFFPPLRRYEDVPFLIDYMNTVNLFAICPVEGYRYSYNYNKATTFSDDEARDILQGMEYVLQICSKNGYTLLKRRIVMRSLTEYSNLGEINRPKDILERYQKIINSDQGY